MKGAENQKYGKYWQIFWQNRWCWVPNDPLRTQNVSKGCTKARYIVLRFCSMVYYHWLRTKREFCGKKQAEIQRSAIYTTRAEKLHNYVTLTIFNFWPMIFFCSWKVYILGGTTILQFKSFHEQKYIIVHEIWFYVLSMFITNLPFTLI